MKVAFIVGEFPILSETFILNQITGLLDRGHEVDIYASDRGDVSKVHPVVIEYQMLDRVSYFQAIPESLWQRFGKGIKLAIQLSRQDISLLFKALNIFKYGKQAASLWMLYTAIPKLDKSYNIIHCQFGYQAFRGMAFRDLHQSQAKLITIFRGYDISSFVKQKGDRIYDRLFEVGDFFLANCEYFRQKAIAIGCPPSQIVVYRSGLDCDRFSFKPRYLPAGDSTIYLATTGRLVEKKGIEYAIKAVAEQVKITPNIEYNILGDGELKNSLQQLITKLNLDKKVHLLGWQDEREIQQILDKTHIFIAPSVTAKNGDRDAPINVLKEAMAMGLPVISTYHGGIPELVEDGVSGCLVPERDVEALAEKLNYLIEHPQQWESMGKAGRYAVETKYNLHLLNDELVKIYQRLLTTDLASEKTV